MPGLDPRPGGSRRIGQECFLSSHGQELAARLGHKLRPVRFQPLRVPPGAFVLGTAAGDCGGVRDLLKEDRCRRAGIWLGFRKSGFNHDVLPLSRSGVRLDHRILRPCSRLPQDKFSAASATLRAKPDPLPDHGRKSRKSIFTTQPACYNPLMTITIEAIYENGVLKPAQPLPLQDHEKVRITIEPDLTWAERTAGMLRWTGDPGVLRRIA